MRQYLVVGNQTLGSVPLRDAIRERVAAGPSRFHVVVPATPTRDHLSWTEGAAVAAARHRLDDALAWMAEEGAAATGEVGDPNPALATADALLGRPVDEIIVSTFPPGISRWIRQDLPHRLARRTDLPVCHVVAAPHAAEAAR